MPRLSEQARHVVVPEGVVSTGWPAVVAKSADLGITFQDWQHGIGSLILAKRADGKYATTIGGTGLSIPRQVGKTFLIRAIIFSLCMLRPGFTAIWTAHRFATAEETFGKMQSFTKRAKIKPYIDRVTTGTGDEAIYFTNGSRILFGSRERGFGRGFDEIDALIFDEAQILGENALDDMVPATNQSRQDTGALQLYMGTPPRPIDNGEVFTRMRTDALSGQDADTAWIEFGADPGFAPTQLPANLTERDWEQIAKANPSYPDSTPREAILRMRKKLGTESFIRQGLGIWDEVAASEDIFGAGAWDGCASAFDPSAPLDAIGVAATHGSGVVASIVGASPVGERVQVRPLDRAPGLGWVVQRVKELQDERHCTVVVDAGGPASMLIPIMQQAGVQVTVPSAADFFDASAGLLEAVRLGTLAHDNYELMKEQAKSAVLRKSERAALDRKKSDVDLLEGATLALWSVQRPQRSVYEDRGFLVLDL